MKMTHRSSTLLAVGAIAGGLGLMWPSASFAQQSGLTEPAPVVAEKTYTGPNRALLGGGLIMLGSTYVASVIVAAQSSTPADNQLNIPVAGPWLDLAQRPGCGGAGDFTCGTETGYRTLIILSGAFQGLGALATLASFFVPEHATVIRTAKAEPHAKPHLTLSPASVGGGGYGVAALGSF